MIFSKIITSLLLAAAQSQGAHIPSTSSRTTLLNLRIISFNIRYAAPASGNEKGWDVRGPYVIDQLSEAATNTTATGTVPVVVGLQEVLHEQLVDIKAGLNGGSSAATAADDDWTHIGTGRDDGAEAGEYCPILYRRTAVNLLDSTQKWLSKTPDEPSLWPGAGSKRYVVVGVFEHAASGKRFIAANTHLDNASREARVEGIKIVLDVIRGVQDKWGPLGVTLSGDFNSEPTEDEEDAYSTLREDGYLRDLYTLAGDTRRSGPYTTFSGFEPDEEKEVEKRIDFIHVGPDPEETWSVQDYQVIGNVVDDIYISDHKAVVGDITLTL